MKGKAKLKRWGNSYGVVVPKEVVEKEGLKEGEVVEISVRKASDIRRLFGKYPFKDLQFEKEEMRKGWVGDAGQILLRQLRCSGLHQRSPSL